MIRIIPMTAADAPLLERLGHLYVYDLSDTCPTDPGEDGWFAERPGFPDTGQAFRIDADGKIAGFAIVLPDTGWFLDDFFILKRWRRHGVGAAAARAIFERHPGAWALTVRAQNGGALVFWRRILEPYAAVESAPRIGPDGNARVRFEWNV